MILLYPERTIQDSFVVNRSRNFFVLTLAGFTQSYSCANFSDCKLTVPETLGLAASLVSICSSCSNLRSCYPASDSIPVPTSAGRLYDFDAENLASIPRGVYSVCVPESTADPLFTLRIQGIESFQMNYCFDQIPCTIKNFQGSPLPSSGSLVVIPMTTTCFSHGNPPIDDFPNQGVSSPPSLNGSTYSFGATAINASQIPAQYRVCWRSETGDLRVPAGTLIIHSFEIYYRKYVMTAPDWQPYDSVAKIFFLSLVLLVAVGIAATLPSLISLVKNRRKRTTIPTIHADPIIARMCDEEVSEDITKALSMILHIPEESVSDRLRTRRQRSQLAHAIYCVSDI